jgi:integrase
MLFVALGLETAARREAIMELTWDRIDLAGGSIDYHRPGRRITKKRRVTGLPISARLRPVLEAAWARAPKDAQGRACGLVLAGAGAGAGAGALRKPFWRFTSAIGMRWVTPHVLRHTWGSISIMAGGSLYDIAEFMGDTVATISKVYLHLTGLPAQHRRSQDAARARRRRGVSPAMR